MSFLNYSAFYFAASIPAVILLYLLKTKRREITIPSIFLWDKMIKDVRAHTSLRWLKKNLLLLLQLLILALLTLGMARPFYTKQVPYGRDILLIMDASASMWTMEGEGVRFDYARERAIGLVDRLKGTSEMAIIKAGAESILACDFTSDKNKLKSAIESMNPEETPTNLRDAILLALPLVSSRGASEIIVISDGAFSAEDQLPQAIRLISTSVEKTETSTSFSTSEEDRSGLRVGFIVIGETSDNLGIVGLSIRRTYYSAFDYEALLQIKNYSDGTLVVPLRLYSGEGQEEEIIYSSEFLIGPHSGTIKIFPYFGEVGTVIRTELGVEDNMSIDNQAYAVLAPSREISILMLSEGNVFLEKAFKIYPHLKVDIVDPALISDEENLPDPSTYDLIICDRIPWPSPLIGNFIFIDTIPPQAPFELRGEVGNPFILDWKRDNPILRFVNLDDVHIDKAMLIERTEDWGDVLVDGDTTPLIYLFEREGMKALFIGFDLLDSDFPLRVAFPIFLSNALSWFLPEEQEAAVSIRAGDSYSPKLTDSGGRTVVVDPLGRRTQLTEGIFTGTKLCGVYRVISGDETESFAVNLLDDEESNVIPRAKLEIADDEEMMGGESLTKVNVELWPYFILSALALILLEWYVYHRQSFTI